MNTTKKDPKITTYMNLLHAEVDVQKWITTINDLAKTNTVAGTSKALKLLPELEKAMQNEQLALVAWLNAIRGKSQAIRDKSQSNGTMTLAQFKKLSPGKRLEFAKAGGKIVD